MDSANEVANFIEKIGIPVAMTIAVGGCSWYLIRYILTSIVEKIGEAQKQTEEEIREQKDILVKLIEKIQMQQNDIIRLDLLLRVKFGLETDDERIGRRPNGKKK